ncbi:hypothetical protein Btru_052400 [Bulinus truncatus]|nr:hypothetical protein Btru_052400 [Bulinus truncatus]
MVVSFEEFAVESCDTSECQVDTLQCQTNFSISSVPQSDLQLICQTARMYLKCVEHVDCESEMYLRLAYKIVSKNISDAYSYCDRRYSNTDCKNRVTACRETYVNNIFVSDSMDSSRNETVICQYLDTFADCLLKISSCNSEREEVEKIVKDEKERMNLKDCETPSLNHGSKTAALIQQQQQQKGTILLALSDVSQFKGLVHDFLNIL